MSDRRAKMRVKNESGSDITDVKLSHRYDEDMHDSGDWGVIPNDTISSDYAGARYRTGFLRLGSDYWGLTFKYQGREWSSHHYPGLGELWNERTLTSDDDGKEVIFTVQPGLYNDLGTSYMKASIKHPTGEGEIKVYGQGGEPEETRKKHSRPVYVIAHQCNDVDLVKEAVRNGANAVEFDLRFYEETKTWVVSHDWISEMVSDATSLHEWLKAVKQIASEPENNLSLIVLDIKDPKYISRYCVSGPRSTQEMSDMEYALKEGFVSKNFVQLIGSYLKDTPLNALFATGDFSEAKYFDGVMPDI